MNVSLYEKFHILALSIVGLVAAEFTPQQEAAFFVVIICALLLGIVLVIFFIAYLYDKARNS